MSIIQLPEEVANKLHSSVLVTSLNSVACNLIKNSLDANATKINLYIDHGKGNCTVEDNGAGISKTEFLAEGGLGKLHRKFSQSLYLGFHLRRF
jgi:DNA mismatch repair protein MLH3